MKLKFVKQDSLAESYDLVVCASGYESRARYIATQIAEKKIKVLNKFVFAFKEHAQINSRVQNDRSFEELCYKALPCSGSSSIEAHDCFESAILKIKECDSVRVLVDISSMTRAWYGEIVHMLLSSVQHKSMQVDFAYTAAQFVPASVEYPPNRIAAPVPGFVGIALPDKPTALGIGLGYDLDRAIGLKDYLDPKFTVLFYPNPSFDPRFVDSVRDTNRKIMSEVSDNNIVAYPVNDCVATFSMLDSLCEGLTRNSRVVLCSFGPKTFGLCCFLVAAVRRDISIWRVSADDKEEPVDHKPIGVPLIVQTMWESS